MYTNANDIKEAGHFEAACYGCLDAGKVQLGHMACGLSPRIEDAYRAGEQPFYAYGSWWMQDYRSRRTVRRRRRRYYRHSRRHDELRERWMDKPPLRVPVLSEVSR
jgi:hypothetical protein